MVGEVIIEALATFVAIRDVRRNGTLGLLGLTSNYVCRTMLIVLSIAAISDIAQFWSPMARYLWFLGAALYAATCGLEFTVWWRHGVPPPRQFPRTPAELTPLAVVALVPLAVCLRYFDSSWIVASLIAAACSVFWISWIRHVRG